MISASSGSGRSSIEQVFRVLDFRLQPIRSKG
uniref:Uncharacterized protein n=1 Tax=Arundo donax TaxID=35708 RepID=A0A0A9HWJ3_ARUDO